MHDQEPILRAPSQVAKDMYAAEPLNIVLGENGRRSSRFALGAFVFLVVAAVAIAFWLISMPTMGQLPAYWGVAIASVLFWIAVTQGMIAVGALLRVAHASWRFPLTRMCDITALFGIPVLIVFFPMLYKMREMLYGPMGATGHVGAAGHVMPIGSAGYQIALFGFEKVWRSSSANGSFFVDCVFTFTAYLTGFFLLWLTSRPDFAGLRDHSEGNKRKFYAGAAGNWIGSMRQWRTLRLGEGFLVIGAIMTFFAAQTALGWDLQLATGMDWDSSIFPFEVNLGALQAGTAMLVLVMTVLGSQLKNKEIGDKQYDSIGKLMIALGLLFFYFRWCDYITAWYGHSPSEWTLQLGRIIRFPVPFIVMVVGCMAVPIFANIFGGVRKSRILLCLISVLMLAGVWCQRFLDTCPALVYGSANAAAPGAVLIGALILVGGAGLLLLTYFAAIPLYSAVSWWGINKWRSRSTQRPLGNSTVTVMVEDPPVWEN